MMKTCSHKQPACHAACLWVCPYLHSCFESLHSADAYLLWQGLQSKGSILKTSMIAGKVSLTCLTELSPGSILACPSRQIEAKPVVKTKRVQLLCIQHPLPALWHSQEPLFVINVNCILVDLVSLLCRTFSSLGFSLSHSKQIYTF